MSVLSPTRKGWRFLDLAVGDFATDGRRLLQVVTEDDHHWLLEDCICAADKAAPVLKLEKQAAYPQRWRRVTPTKDGTEDD